jgi:hypothetical protein
MKWVENVQGNLFLTLYFFIPFNFLPVAIKKENTFIVRTLSLGMVKKRNSEFQN